MYGPDENTRKIGHAIELQAEASGDQFDMVLWGLWENRSKASVTTEDWSDSNDAAYRHSLKQVKLIEEETDLMANLSSGILDGLLSISGTTAGGLTGTGVIGLLSAWLLRNRKELKGVKDDLITSVKFGHDAIKVDPKNEDDVKDLKNTYRDLSGSALKDAVEATKPRSA